jgi:hypothetical protein
MKDRNLVHSDNWATPIEFYDNLDLEFAFNFDPCPLNLNEITDETDGLLIDWGTSNFINIHTEQANLAAHAVAGKQLIYILGGDKSVPDL